MARHMHTVWVPEPPEASLRLIYEQILTGYLNHEIPALLPLFPTFGAQVVAGTTNIYSQVVQHLRPTPKKSHYTFNTRDVSNVFQGMLMVAKQHLLPAASTALDTVGTENVLDVAADSMGGGGGDGGGSMPTVAKKLLRLWLHEQCRVVYDRLVDSADQDWFANICQQVTTSHFPTMTVFNGANSDNSDNNDNNDNSDSNTTTPTQYVESLMFASLTGADDDSEYCEHQASSESDIYHLSDALTAQLEEFKVVGGGQVADLVFFRDAIAHVARLTRVLCQPGGNALLVGVGGSGRKSLARLASFMSGSSIKTIEVTSQYGMLEWREDIKLTLMAAGLDRKHSVFMIDDTQIVNESFLEDINSILTSGEVLNIYEPEDMEKIISESKQEAEQASNGNTLGREGTVPVLCVLTMVLTVIFDCVF